MCMRNCSACMNGVVVRSRVSLKRSALSAVHIIVACSKLHCCVEVAVGLNLFKFFMPVIATITLTLVVCVCGGGRVCVCVCVSVCLSFSVCAVSYTHLTLPTRKNV